MKISFTKPANLDGAKLVQELIAAGVSVAETNGKPNWVEIDGNGLLWIEIEPKDEQKTAEIVANHDAS